jgi:RNA polymerase sigma-70 factor (ECF subfamily)
LALEQLLRGPSAHWGPAEPDGGQAYAELWPRVVNFFRYRLGDTADASELAAQTFEKAGAARDHSGCDAAGFAPWVLMIARNVAIDHVRARSRRGSPEPSTIPSAPGPTPDQGVHGFEAERFAELLATLPPRQRELIAMKYGAEMSNGAIARATGLSEGNVDAILHRAVESLRVRRTFTRFAS